jgi:hypothetical protein
MKSQINFDGRSSYKTASPSSGVSKPQSNFNRSGSGTGPKGGTNRSKPQVNFGDKYKGPGPKSHGSHFGEKPGTGCNNGY